MYPSENKYYLSLLRSWIFQTFNKLYKHFVHFQIFYLNLVWHFYIYLKGNCIISLWCSHNIIIFFFLLGYSKFYQHQMLLKIQLIFIFISRVLSHASNPCMNRKKGIPVLITANFLNFIPLHLILLWLLTELTICKYIVIFFVASLPP